MTEPKPNTSSQARRVAILSTNLDIGGIQRVFLNLAEGLLKKGIAIDFVLSHRHGELLEEIPSSARLFVLADDPVPRRSLKQLVNYLKRENPDAILAGDDALNVLAIIAKRLARWRGSVLVSTHTTLSTKYAKEKSWRVRVRGRLLGLFYPFADHRLAVSGGAAEDQARWTFAPRKSIEVIYNVVVNDSLLELAGQPVDHPWFQPGELPVIVSVGRLVLPKAYPVLLTAFAEVRQSIPCRLVIFGEGEDRADLEALAKRLGIENDFALPGFVNNPVAYVAKAAVYALSSEREGLPTALIEAFATGVPVVSTDCKSGPREVLADGKWGKLVPVGDAKALAEGIKQALKQGRIRLPEESYAPFTEAIIADKYIEIMFRGKA